MTRQLRAATRDPVPRSLYDACSRSWLISPVDGVNAVPVAVAGEPEDAPQRLTRALPTFSTFSCC